MGRYSSVRGWIQITEEMVALVEEIINEYSLSHDDYDLSDEQAKLYQSAWYIQKKAINWSRYVFYGADIRTESIDFVKEQILDIATQIEMEDAPYIDFPKGYFIINDENEDCAHVWRFDGGHFSELVQEGLFK